ncbi:SIS domain-containing protein [Ostreiculturibacter nitratireducens]|uniref:SIS domain-containing protein n=1 Tax=Ostreiculturibacter nitratireducens TaxID=3075226 RepID=UPI0031B64DEC
MSEAPSLMRQEIEEIPEAVERLLRDGGGDLRAAAEALRKADPAYVCTVARGSSDHACTYLKYAYEILLGLPVASLGPSVASVYRAPLRLGGSACLSVSQSGRSPDIIAMTKAARDGGALTVAITNDAASPLADTADLTVPIHAGPELSVAATKTFVTSAVAGLAILAEVKGDAALLAALRELPSALSAAVEIDWPEIREALSGQDSLYTLGRGPGFAMSGEAALKFKETCRIHAESYSSAEVLHGPVSIVEAGFPVLCFAAGDAAEEAVSGIADEIAAKGGRVFVTSDQAKAAQRVAHVRTGHWLMDPLALIVSFYAFVERVAAERGIDPDVPRHLRKVTETV